MKPPGAAALALCVFIPGCQSTLDRINAEGRATEAAQDASDLASTAFADKRGSEARGTKTCIIKQFSSAYQTKRYIERRATGAVTVRPFSSKIAVKVHRDGSAAITVRTDKYPGTHQFFLIAGKRYAGPERQWVPLDRAALAALKADAVVKYSYNNWPSRAEGNGEDVLGAFAKAYDECLAYLRG